MSDHAFLPPSGAKIWVKCAAAPSMWRRYPAPESIDTREGTAAHWAWEELLAGRNVDVGLVAPNGVVLTDEMVEGADMYADHVRAETKGLQLFVEHTIRMDGIHVNNWGTPDTFAYDEANKTIHLFDYKFGHDYVDEFENWQLINYSHGILAVLGIDGFEDQRTTINMTIIQPRCYHRDGPIRRVVVRAVELRGWFNVLRAAAEAASGTQPRAIVNPNCKHCSGRHACETLQRAGYDAANISRISLPLDLPPAALGLELKMLKKAKASLDARISGLEESVFSAITRGESIPGWGAEAGDGRQKWTKPFGQVKILGEMIGVDLVKPALITPKQAIKAGAPVEVINEISQSLPGALRLVEDNLTLARKVFGK